jgi:hypothetical protein
LLHALPVLDGVADVSEHVAKLVGDLFLLGRVCLAVGFDVHPGLDESIRHLGDGGVGLPHVADLEQLARDVAPNDELWVNHQVNRTVPAGQRHRDRVDQERHVVGNHLDDGVAGGPTVLLDGGGVHANQRPALRPGLCKLTV